MTTLPLPDIALDDMAADELLTMLIRAGYQVTIRTDGAFGGGQIAVDVETFDDGVYVNEGMGWGEDLKEAIIMAWPDDRTIT